MPMTQSRRYFLTNASIALGAILMGAPPARADERLETTSLRFMKSPSICLAPQDVADELLRAEGFKDIHYLPVPSLQEALAGGEVDLGLEYAAKYVETIDRGLAVTVLAARMSAASSCSATEIFGASPTLKAKGWGSKPLDPHLIYFWF
jgi:NitT/TauT family transport system substrate-binding protein